MAADGVTAAELARGKGMAKGSYVLGLEDTGSRMSRLAKGELLYGDPLTVDELLARVDAVTLDEVNALATELCGQPMSLAVVGPFEDGDFRFSGVSRGSGRHPAGPGGDRPHAAWTSPGHHPDPGDTP